MEEVIKIFKQIQNTSSTNEKKTIITAHKDNELFKKCLVFLLDSNIQTGLSSKKISKEVSKAEYILSTFEDVMIYLQAHNTGTDYDISMVQGFINEQPKEYRDFYTEMVTKKFKLGCNKKVVNSAIPHLIPVFDVQQAYAISEKNTPKNGEIFFLSQKLNGVNCSYVHGKLVSRQGKLFNGLDHILHDIKQIPNHDQYFFNGELIRNNVDNLADNDNFQLGTGIIKAENVDKSCIQFRIYEMLPIEEFEDGQSKLGYKARREQYLNGYLSDAIKEHNLKNILVVPIEYQGSDLSVIQPMLKDAVAKGWEGLMLNKDTKWVNRRNNGILKVKAFKHADIWCIGVIEGDGKYAGTLGSIECDYKGYKLGVSGFTDELRSLYWKNPEKIVGKIVQIKYKEETRNQKGGLSAQFPEFECVRFDKTEPSYED